MLKKLLECTGIGLAIGFLCTTALLWIYNAGSDGTAQDMLVQFTVWLGASFLYGLVSSIYCSERISFLAQTILHFILCALITATASLSLGYFSLSQSGLPSLFGILGTFILVYAIIYLALFFVSRQNAKKINQKLQKK